MREMRLSRKRTPSVYAVQHLKHEPFAIPNSPQVRIKHKRREQALNAYLGLRLVQRVREEPFQLKCQIAEAFSWPCHQPIDPVR